MTRVLHEDMEYDNFEEQLVLFQKALRYWKKYLQGEDAVETKAEGSDSLSMLSGLS